MNVWRVRVTGKNVGPKRQGHIKRIKVLIISCDARNMNTGRLQYEFSQKKPLDRYILSIREERYKIDLPATHGEGKESGTTQEKKNSIQ